MSHRVPINPTRADALAQRSWWILLSIGDCMTSAPVFCAARLIQELLAAVCCGGYSAVSDKRPKADFPCLAGMDVIKWNGRWKPKRDTTFRIAVHEFWRTHMEMQVGIGIAGCACPLNMPAPCFATAAAHSPGMAALYGAGWLWAGSLALMVCLDASEATCNTSEQGPILG